MFTVTVIPVIETAIEPPVVERTTSDASPNSSTAINISSLAPLASRATRQAVKHPHAVRILGGAWAHVIWACWHNDLSYDPAQHRALQILLANTTTEAA